MLLSQMFQWIEMLRVPFDNDFLVRYVLLNIIHFRIPNLICLRFSAMKSTHYNTNTQYFVIWNWNAEFWILYCYLANVFKWKYDFHVRKRHHIPHIKCVSVYFSVQCLRNTNVCHCRVFQIQTIIVQNHQFKLNFQDIIYALYKTQHRTHTHIVAIVCKW